MKLKFLKDAYYNDELMYKQDSVYEIDNSKGHASRWLNRLFAEEIVEEKPETSEKPIKTNLRDFKHGSKKY